jgi:hypothetical protein
MPERSSDRIEDVWTWEIENPLTSGVAGDVAALFRAEGIDAPGVLALEPPTPNAALFAREAIQNSWDAAREWSASLKSADRSVEPFWIEFRFHEFRGYERSAMVSKLGLLEHRSQFDGASRRSGAKQNLGLADTDLLSHLMDDDTPLRVLVMEEHSGLGMPGSFERSDSRMLQALLRVGYTQKADGSGGSYGYGKAGLIAASAIRTIVAYSAFEPVASDPNVSRRLLGVTYWKSHERGDVAYTGWARFGREAFMHGENGTKIRSAVPFENDEADDVAGRLGIRIRDVKKPGDTGTTFLIVDPTISAFDLKRAIERYWWPAMLDPSSGLRTKIVDYDGTEIFPSVPKDDPNFLPFIRAYELATRPQDNPHKEESSFDLGEYSPQGSRDDYRLGTLGMVADTQGWSFPNGGGDVEHCTMVALVRGPRMVVNYATFRRMGIPHVRGTFVADPGVDDLLRQTEDKAHTKWDGDKQPGAHPHAHLVATQVNTRLREAVVDFKSRFKPPAPRPGDLHLPILDELSRLMKGSKPKPPPTPKRPVTINLVSPARAVATRDGRLQCEATVEFSIADWVWASIADDDVDLSVTLSVSFVEDERLGERLAVSATPSGPGFVRTSGTDEQATYVGRLARGESVKFISRSASYDPDWTVRFTPIAAVIRPVIGTARPARGNV